MSKTINNGGPAFPAPITGHNGGIVSLINTDASGMTLREYAAIKLRVPDSGTDWLDEMIRKSVRDEFAAKAMQGILANPTYFEMLQDQAVELDRLGHITDAYKLVSELSRDMADDMLRARGEA